VTFLLLRLACLLLLLLLLLLLQSSTRLGEVHPLNRVPKALFHLP
jgi:hypothetical protein